VQEETAALRNFDWTYVRSGVIHEFPPSQRVRFAPRADHSDNARVYEYAP